MRTRNVARPSICVLAAMLLGGCAFGQKVGYSGVKAGVLAQGTSTVTVVTRDARPYVVSGHKKPNFVGLSRGGFGNPFDVDTQSGADRALRALRIPRPIQQSVALD